LSNGVHVLIKDSSRRGVIALLGGAALWPLAVRAQSPAAPVIGFLGARSAESDRPFLVSFHQGLAEFGYVDRRTLAIEYRWAEAHYDRLPALAADLVQRRVAVLVAIPDPAAQAAKAATSTIPIVFITGGDPVKFGLVDSISRPGGNATGVSGLMGALAAKQIGLLSELAPPTATVAILVNPKEPAAETQIADAQVAAGAIGKQLLVLKASTEPEIEAAFAALSQQRIGALLIGLGPFFVTVTKKIVALAARHAVPTMYFRREFADAGGLISYGPSTTEIYRQLGIYTARILKGEKPADLPVVQPTKLEMVINLKAAKAIGLDVSPMLLARADDVIE
jgi:putative ABC transport system substrate-binding protein